MAATEIAPVPMERFEGLEVPHFISPHQITREWFDRTHYPLAVTMMEVIHSKAKLPYLWGHDVYVHFQDKSTRTRESFVLAAQREMADVCVTENGENSSDGKEESPLSLRMMQEDYEVSLFIIRTDGTETADLARESKVPIMNAGDRYHPTQATLDLSAVRNKRRQMGLDLYDMTVGFASAPNTRVVRSDVIALVNNFDPRKFYFIAHSDLQVGSDITNFLKEKGVDFETTDDLEGVAPQLDWLCESRYWAANDPRLAHLPTTGAKVEEAKRLYGLDRQAATPRILNLLPEHGIASDALPANGEVREEDADHPKLIAFRAQAKWGYSSRMALILEMVDPTSAYEIIRTGRVQIAKPQFYIESVPVEQLVARNGH